MPTANLLWARWKSLAHRVASVQARIVLGLLYFAVLLPFAMLLRFHSHPFRAAGWQKHEAPDASHAEAARRQF